MKRRKIDLDFRPSTYWPAKTRRGQRARELPPEQRSPVTIACIILHSAIGDQISIRAGWSSRGCIWYRASDGYDDHEVYFSPAYSRRPLTLRTLINGLDGLSADAGGDFFDVSPNGWSEGASDGFVEVCSRQYPQLETWYERRSNSDDEGAEKVLTAEIARIRTRYGIGLDFSEFTSIEDAAVPFLAAHRGTLCLDGLRELSDKAARGLSQHRGDLTLRSLWELSDEAAKSFCRHQGALYLNGLQSLSEDAADALAMFDGHLTIDLDAIPRCAAAILCAHPSFLEEGETLADFYAEDDEDPTLLTRDKAEQMLDDPGTESLSKYLAIEDAAAEMLTEYDDSLFLDGLTCLSDTAAESLSRNQFDLSLNGLTSLSGAAAESLSKHQGGDLSLDGLTNLSDEAAESLGKYRGYLSLNGLTNLTAAAEDSLSRHEGGLSLAGLSSLSDALAVTLGRNDTSLRFPRLTSLSDAAADGLSKCRGDLDLSGLTSLSDAAAESLSKCSGWLFLRGLTSLSLSAAALESLSKHKRYVGPRKGDTCSVARH